MIYRFEDCVLDTGRRVLARQGAPVHVEPQVFDLLEILAGAGGAVVSKEELIATVWRGLNVSDATISARISAARRAVGDDGTAQRIVRTVPKRGFQMAARPDDVPEPRQAGAQHVPSVRFARSADGERIAFCCQGDGPPLMRVGHWLSHLELDRESPVWQPLLARLGEGFTLCRYDQRGTGLSTRDAGNLTLDAFAADLEAVADAAGLERFAIFAASQAVPVAIRFAARNPGRVSRMVLYGGYATGRIYRETAEGEVNEETILGLIRAGWGQAGSAFLDAFTTLFMPDATPEQVRNIVRIQRETVSPENAALLRQAVDRFVVEGDLPRIQAPVLVMHARSDAIQPMSQGQHLAACIPGAEFVMLDSRNHAPLPQDPCWEVLVRNVLSFCGGAVASPG